MIDESSEVLVATIGSKKSADCQPGISPGNEWCSPEVHKVDAVCGLSLEDARLILSETVRKAMSENWWASWYVDWNSLSRRRKQLVNRRIHAAHSRALRSLCSVADKKGSRFGLVLESDADTNFFIRLLDALDMTLEQILVHYKEVTVFNLGSSVDICYRTEHAQKSALQRGFCFVRHAIGTWGAVAVGYKRRRRMSPQNTS